MTYRSLPPVPAPAATAVSAVSAADEALRVLRGGAIPARQRPGDRAQAHLRALRLRRAATGGPDPLRTRAQTLGIPCLHLPDELPADCRGALPSAIARELRAVPVGRTRVALTVAMDARWDATRLRWLTVAAGLEIFPVLTTRAELDRALGQLDA